MLSLKHLIAPVILCGFLNAKEVNLYTQRHYEADKTILSEFTKKTGIEVNVVKAGANELIARMKSEQENPQADIYMTVDAATLERATKEGLFQKLNEPKLTSSVLDGICAESDTWVPVTMRARVLVYAKDKVNAEDAPKTYEEIADSKWKGQLLIRSSSSHYNQSLLASVYANAGKEAALAWAKGVKDNMARPPQGGDRDQVRALAKGLGQLAVTNSYYLGLLEKSSDENDRNARAAVGVVFPDLAGQGTHVNISGAGIIKNAKNRKEAVQLLEYLLSPEVQAQYQKLTSEFAVVKGIEKESLQKNWGAFTPDVKSLHKLNDSLEKSVKLFDLVGWQ